MTISSLQLLAAILPTEHSWVVLSLHGPSMVRPAAVQEHMAGVLSFNGPSMAHPASVHGAIHSKTPATCSLTGTQWVEGAALDQWHYRGQALHLTGVSGAFEQFERTVKCKA